MPCPADVGASLGYEIESATPKKKKVIQGINKDPYMLKGLLDLMDLVCSLAIPAMLGDHFLKNSSLPCLLKWM